MIGLLAAALNGLAMGAWAEAERGRRIAEAERRRRMAGRLTPEEQGDREYQRMIERVRSPEYWATTPPGEHFRK